MKRKSLDKSGGILTERYRKGMHDFMLSSDCAMHHFGSCSRN